MRVWISKYALTRGIIEADATRCSTGDMVKVEKGSGSDRVIYFHGEGRDWHLTLNGAVAKAEEQRKKKIVVLKKTLSKLERMDFTKGG